MQAAVVQLFLRLFFYTQKVQMKAAFAWTLFRGNAIIKAVFLFAFSRQNAVFSGRTAGKRGFLRRSA